jgi:hypothetical protein
MIYGLCENKTNNPWQVLYHLNYTPTRSCFVLLLQFFVFLDRVVFLPRISLRLLYLYSTPDIAL